MNERERRMVGHGAVVTLLGLAAGFGLVMSLIGGFEIVPGVILDFEIFGNPRSWARTHAGGLMNGLLVFVGALLSHAMQLPERAAAKVYWMLVGAGYANTIFYWGGMLAPSRALTFGDNRLGETSIAGVIGFFPALVFAVITMWAMFIIAQHGFAKAQTD
jgi:hypothetical protein